MRRIKKSQMRYVEGVTGHEFQDNYNKAMDELTAANISVDEKMISLEKLSAVILYTEVVEMPENMKDRYALKGIYPTCEECPYFEKLTDYSGICPFMKFRSGTHYANMDICDKRWKELETMAAMERRRANEIPEPKGRTGEEGVYARAAR